MNEVLFQCNFANNTTWSCGICVSSRGEIIRLSLNHNLVLIFLTTKVDVMLQW